MKALIAPLIAARCVAPRGIERGINAEGITAPAMGAGVDRMGCRRGGDDLSIGGSVVGQEKRWWSHASREPGMWRWWLHRPSSSCCDAILQAEATWGSRYHLTGVWLRRNDEGKWSASLGLFWAYLSVGWRTPWSHYRGYGSGREVALTFHDKAMWWKIWVDPDCWESSRPKWRDGNFHPIDIAFGRQDCTRKTLEERDVLVPMPERPYRGHAKLVEYTWKRPRSPLVKRMKRVEIEMDGDPIPHAGKGENSWDCGDDATFGMTTGECNTIPDGVGVLVGSCLRTRVKNGGWGDYEWKREAAE